MPPKTAEQKARKKAMEAEKKARLEAEKAAKAAGAAAPPPAPTASSSATPPAPPSTTAPAAPAPSATPPSSASAYDNVSSSRLLCLPLDSLAYSLTFLPARELGAVMIASSFVTKTVLPVFQLKFVMSRCKRMLPDPADLAIDVDKNMARAQELLNRAVAAGFNVSADKIARVNKKIAKAQNAGAGAAKAPLLPTRPEDGVVSFPSFARFLDEALQNYCPLRTNKHADMLPEHAAGRFCSCSPEHSVVRAGGGDRGGGGSGVYTWGVGQRGQLGRGKREDNATPSPLYMPIGFKTRIVQVAAGGGLVRVAHTLLLTDVGRVLSFGCAMYGALGHGMGAGAQLNDETRPRYIEQLASERVTCVAAGELHSAVVTEDGDCLTFGEGFCGQLGQGNKRPSLTPGQVLDEFEDENAVTVSCGCRHTLILTDEGEVWSFGLGYFGVLGRSFTPFEYGAKNTGIDQVLDEVMDLDELADLQAEQAAGVAAVEAPAAEAASHTFLTDDQQTNLDNLSITLEDSSDQVRPRKIEALEGITVTSISAGHRHNLCLDEAGGVYSWGSSGGGCLGHGDYVKREVPERILELTHLTTDEATHVTQVSAGVDASMIVLKNGDVYSWGRTKGGRIGLGSGCGPTVTQPRKVQLGEFDRRAVACDVGYVHSLIVTATGQILQCGKVGVDDEADGGSEQLEGDDVVAKVLDGPGANVWQRQREPIETIVQEKYKKYGTYSTKGRSSMMAEQNKWNPNAAAGKD